MQATTWKARGGRKSGNGLREHCGIMPSGRRGLANGTKPGIQGTRRSRRGMKLATPSWLRLPCRGRRRRALRCAALRRASHRCRSRPLQLVQTRLPCSVGRRPVMIPRYPCASGTMPARSPMASWSPFVPNRTPVTSGHGHSLGDPCGVDDVARRQTLWSAPANTRHSYMPEGHTKHRKVTIGGPPPQKKTQCAENAVRRYPVPGTLCTGRPAPLAMTATRPAAAVESGSRALWGPIV